MSLSLSHRIPLGSVLLSDVTNLKILRTKPSTVKRAQQQQIPISNNEDEETNNLSEGMNREYWSNSTNHADNKAADRCHLPTQTRWEQVTEDNLKLVSTKGTLFLRFLVDLLDQEMMIEDSRATAENLTTKNQGCIRWCQSISHTCGTEQLKQNLPNFGKGGEEEVSDFIEMSGNSSRRSDLFQKSTEFFRSLRRM